MQYPQFTLPGRNRPDEKDDTVIGVVRPKKFHGLLRTSAQLRMHRLNRTAHTCNKAENGEKSHIGTEESI
jgi:hypothetical protein